MHYGFRALVGKSQYQTQRCFKLGTPHSETLHSFHLFYQIITGKCPTSPRHAYQFTLVGP